MASTDFQIMYEKLCEWDDLKFNFYSSIDWNRSVLLTRISLLSKLNCNNKYIYKDCCTTITIPEKQTVI